MDELDRKVIIELQKDPRQRNNRLAAILHISEHTVRRRIENLISSGTLVPTILPNLKMLGYPIRVYMLLEVEPARLDDIRKQLLLIPNLGFISRCIGLFKFYVRGDFTSIAAMMNFNRDILGKIQGINAIETMVECQGVKNSYLLNRFSQSTGQLAPKFEDASVNEIDRLLIVQLEKNARTPFKQLANVTGVSQVTISRHIKDLVNSKTIEFAVIPNIEDIGYPTIAYARIHTQPSMTSDVAEKIARFPQIHYVGIITGAAELLISIYGLSNNVISDFFTSELNKIDGIIHVESFCFLDILKQTFTWLSQ
ncbi:MAG TPA: Lrp/AsnC family transcriptional regulator [Dehalococcoidales bacterium]|nr:Lrp/AsnC family transcriptional regulator [Dehalococcoidales bacterium]